MHDRLSRRAKFAGRIHVYDIYLLGILKHQNDSPLKINIQNSLNFVNGVRHCALLSTLKIANSLTDFSLGRRKLFQQAIKIISAISSKVTVVKTTTHPVTIDPIAGVVCRAVPLAESAARSRRGVTPCNRFRVHESREHAF